MTEDHDLLVRIDQKVGEIKEDVSALRASDIKQWDKIDRHGQDIAGQKSDINHLTWAVRAVVGAVIATVIGAWGWVN